MQSLVIKTKFIPPLSSELAWVNSKLWARYEESSRYPLTIIKAGPGYGKSTTLVSYFSEYYDHDYYWYNVDDLDSDPALFFLNFIHAFKYKKEKIGDRAIRLLNQSGNNRISLRHIIDIFINELFNKLKGEHFIVIDDFHLVSNKKKIIELLTYFINRIPPNLHLLIATREDIDFPQWATWLLKKKMMLIEEKELSLNRREIQNFLEFEYNISLNEKDIDNIYQETEGWIMAIDLIGEGLDNGTGLDEIINSETNSLSLLFEYLAFEVLENQSKEIREFLLKTAVLKYLRADICNQLLDIDYSGEIIQKIVEKRLFTYFLTNGQYRYHHLFHEFLLEQGKKEYNYRDFHKKAAKICQEKGKKGFAIYHSLGAEDYENAAELILSSAEKLFELGRLDTLQKGLDKLPDGTFAKYPLLNVYQGDIYRLRSHFNQALHAYKNAEDYFIEKADKIKLSIVFQRIAMIYLDTVQPSRADQYLKKALTLCDEKNFWDESDLLKLMAENKANEGQLKKAEYLYQQAEDINDKDVIHNNFSARVRLRTGRLRGAKKILEKKVGKEKDNDRIPRSHRETILILSIINSFMGNSTSAVNYAQDGIYLGDKFNSPFVKAVAYMRLGHSFQLQGRAKAEKADDAYQKSLNIIDEFYIPRGKAEPLMGLALLEAFYGDCDLGLKYGKDGEKISEKAGDEWLARIIKLSLGINYYFKADFKKAEKIFLENINKFNELNDKFLVMVNSLWLSLIYYEFEKNNKFILTAESLFDIVEENNFEFIFLRSTLLAGDEPERFVPVLLKARESNIKIDYINGILAEMGLSHLENHPGYKLKIKGLGDFRVWRGKWEIESKDWEREKARELFLLFIVHMGELIPKEKIYYYLWPKKNEKKAARNFKVTLNALKKALEPNRQPRQEPYFIIRKGSSYGFNKEAGYSYDIEEFERLISKGEKKKDIKEQIKYFELALEKYANFAADKLYLDWIRDERERLRSLFLNTGDKLIEKYYEVKNFENCIEFSNKILGVDNCWEKAYLYKMKSYYQLNRRSMAIKVYNRCKITLDRELNVFPISAIEKYYKKLI